MRSTEIVEMLEHTLTYLSNPAFLESLNLEEIQQLIKDKDKLQQLKEGFEKELFLFLGKHDIDSEDQVPDWNFNYTTSHLDNPTFWNDTNGLSS